MSDKAKCMSILPYISGLYQTKIITSGEKNTLVSLCMHGHFNSLSEKAEDLFHQTGNQKARAIRDIARKE